MLSVGATSNCTTKSIQKPYLPKLTPRLGYRVLNILYFFFQLTFLGSGSEESSSCLEPGLEENEVDDEQYGDEEEGSGQDDVLDTSESIFLVEDQPTEPGMSTRKGAYCTMDV